MIRRPEQREFFLFTQATHARVTSELVRLVGNERIASPANRDLLEQAARHHEDGFADHDSSPKLNGQKYPIDSNELTWQSLLPAWSKSTDESIKIDPWVALLVSVHGLQLSNDISRAPDGPRRYEMAEMRRMFEANKFQQRQIEIQEKLRASLGMKVDEVRRMGIAHDLNAPREMDLAIDYRLLGAMNVVATALLAGESVAGVAPHVHEKSGALVQLILRMHERRLMISPWPFANDRVSINANFKRYPALPTRSVPELQYQYGQLPEETIELILAPK
ncbi:MAG TPA: DUF3891 family protein [Tepidisphaeraceae bacterium]|nr:DUF3891 family protein [Tepidisphaeraceae bacterium]